MHGVGAFRGQATTPCSEPEYRNLFIMFLSVAQSTHSDSNLFVFCLATKHAYIFGEYFFK